MLENRPCRKTSIRDRITDIIAVAAFAPAIPFLSIAARKRWSLRLARKLQDRLGVTVVRNHYYEPVVVSTGSACTSSRPRDLPGIDWNLDGQIKMLNRFRFADELYSLEGRMVGEHRFSYTNGMYEAGDAEALYSFVRAFKPMQIVEIGSGYSTLIAKLAIEANRMEKASYTCQQTCFEPFEVPWLEGISVDVKRQPVEQADVRIVEILRPNDILFIDSSHVVRSSGDVVCEILDILPRVPVGVFVHVHDIFSPRDYPVDWLLSDRRFWNEQYLLEAFLSFNRAFEIVCAINDLHQRKIPALADAFPVLADHPESNPAAFWMRRVK